MIQFSREDKEGPRFIHESLDVLEGQLAEITTVTAWAAFMGFSRSYFCSRFTSHFGEPPSRALRYVRYKKIHKLILQYPDRTSHSIAREVGLRDEQALYKFLSNHFNTNFTEVRHKLLKGNI